MNSGKLRLWVGLTFIVIPVLVNIPYAVLIATFHYPDILREPAGNILLKFQEGGGSLILTWWSFAIVGTPLLFSISGLYRIMKRDDAPYLLAATVFGIVATIAQIIGLMRWTFVVPILAQAYTDPLSSPATRDAALVMFQVVHQYGGVVIGEHIGQSFTIIWMVLVSAAMFRSPQFKPWLAWFGLVSALMYLPAQLELFHTVLPHTPVLPAAGLAASLVWHLWMILIGIALVRYRADPDVLGPRTD